MHMWKCLIKRILKTRFMNTCVYLHGYDSLTNGLNLSLHVHSLLDDRPELLELCLRQVLLVLEDGLLGALLGLLLQRLQEARLGARRAPQVAHLGADKGER